MPVHDRVASPVWVSTGRPDKTKLEKLVDHDEQDLRALNSRTTFTIGIGS
jgi:hypothetical protein